MRSRPPTPPLLAGVQGITDLISSNSYIHVDFNDVNAILRGAGTALFGIGSARGEDRATQAAEIAISSPLLEESIEGAHGALINIAGPSDLKLQEAAAATQLVGKASIRKHRSSGVFPSTTLTATKCVSLLSPQALMPTPRRRLRLKPEAGRACGKHGAAVGVVRSPEGSGGSAAAPASAYSDSGSPEGAAAVHLYSVHSRNPSFRHSTRPPSMKWCLSNDAGDLDIPDFLR